MDMTTPKAKRKVPQKVIYPGNAKQKAVCEELDRTVGVVAATWMESPVEVRTSTMAIYLVLPSGRVEEAG